MKRHLVLWFVVGVIAWNIFNFFARSARNGKAGEFNRFVVAAPNVEPEKPTKPVATQPSKPVLTKPEPKPVSKATVPTTPPPATEPTPLVIPTVPVPDNEPAIWYGKNRGFNHSIWKKFPVPRLVNFPANGKYLEEGLKAQKAGTFPNRVYHIGQQGYSLGASNFPADCPFKCDFGSDGDAAMVGSPGSCSPNKLSFVFGLESTAHSWWGQESSYKSCAFTMRSNLDATVPMLGQVKSFMPVDMETGILRYKQLPWVPYKVKKERRWLTAMISNCVSTRLQIFSKLHELGISTSQYGGCGHGETGEPIPYGSLDPVQAGILRQLESGDKFLQKEALIAPSLFHFAAENSVCDFYHTEKLFGALKAGTVPVYFGARTIYPYLPEKSVLFVYDYDNVFELAEHIKALAENETAYNEYLEWRKKPLAEPLMDILTVGRAERSPEWQCDMCKLVATTPKGSYEKNYDDCESFPLEQFLTKGFKLREHVKNKMQKDRPGGRRW